jgi:hypothetical protein
MEVTDAGMVIEVREVSLSNALTSMIVHPVPSSTLAGELAATQSALVNVVLPEVYGMLVAMPKEVYIYYKER